MKLMPEKTTHNLLKVLGYYAAILYAVLLLCHAVFRSGFSFRSLIGLASIAAVVAMAAGLGFWLEGKLFFPIFTGCLVIGMLYMLYVAVFNSAPGWGDMASLFGFAAIVLIGLGAGLSAEFVKYLLKPRLKQE
jgi:hypothetical protein